MPKMIRCGLVTLGVIVLVLLIWIFRPYSSPDSSSVSKYLSELEEPFQRVDAAYYLDGGSVDIRIVDARGRETDFCLRAALGDGERRYERLYYGALHYTEEPSSEIPQPSDTILRLLEIVRAAEGVSRDCDVAVASASGRWRDFRLRQEGLGWGFPFFRERGAFFPEQCFEVV